MAMRQEEFDGLVPAEFTIDEAPFTIEQLAEALFDPETGEVVGRIVSVPVDAVPGDDAPIVERWRVKSDSEAEWAMALYRQFEAELAAATERKTAMLARIEAWYGGEQRRVAGNLAFFESRLTEYLRGRQAEVEDPKKRPASIKLVNGRIASTTYQPKPEVEGEAALIQFVKDSRRHLASPSVLDDVVKVKESVLVSELAKVVDVVEVPIEGFDDDELAARVEAGLPVTRLVVQLTLPAEAFDAPETDGEPLILEVPGAAVKPGYTKYRIAD